MFTLKQFVLVAGIIALGAVFGAGLYQSTVEAPNFNTGIPESLEHYRLFMSVANPGNYFRIAAPAAQVLVLLSLILNWRNPRSRRWWLLAGLVLIIGADVITFSIHYPRNALLFTAPMSVPVEDLKKAAAEWMMWNHVRVVIVLASLVCVMRALVLNKSRETP